MPMILQSGGNVSMKQDPPVPPYLGDLFPLLVMKVNESILSPALYSTCVMYSSLGTSHGSRSPPPCPPNWGESKFVTPSLSQICMLSISEPDLTCIFLALMVGLAWDHSNGPPPPPPQSLLLPVTTLAGNGLGLSGVGSLHLFWVQQRSRADRNEALAALQSTVLSGLKEKRSERGSILQVIGMGSLITSSCQSMIFPVLGGCPPIQIS